MSAFPGQVPRGAAIGLASLATGLLLFVLVAWFLHNFHRVEVEVDSPPRGEASYNPLYALKQALLADGVRVQSRQRLNLVANDLGPRDTVLLYGDPRSLSPPEVARLLRWVEGGGHLLVRSPAGRDAGGADLEVPLYEALGAYAKGEDGSRACLDFQVPGEPPHVEFCGGIRFGFVADVVPELAWGDLKNGYALARLHWGQGHVDFVSDFTFLGNGGRRGGLFAMPGGGYTEGLKSPTHHVLARQLLAPNYGQGTMHLVYAARLPSLWRQLLANGWMVWLPLLLALLAWLWSRMQRFGPLRPDPPQARRSLLEHVGASGELLLRLGKGPLLHAAVRRAFLARLRRRDPMAAALEGELQALAIAERLTASPDQVRKALQTPAANDKLALRERISFLIKSRNQL